ncbi:MAG: hypothetical protein QXM55_04415, partial [Ignisphaera sp.]
MKMFIDELTYYNELKKLAFVIGKPCIWSIVSVLIESDNKTINITSLVSRLNSNYRSISTCLDYMKKLNIVEEIVIGRLRIIKLLDTPLTQAMSIILKEIKGYSSLFLSK